MSSEAVTPSGSRRPFLPGPRIGRRCLVTGQIASREREVSDGGLVGDSDLEWQVRVGVLLGGEGEETERLEEATTGRSVRVDDQSAEGSRAARPRDTCNPSGR